MSARGWIAAVAALAACAAAVPAGYAEGAPYVPASETTVVPLGGALALEKSVFHFDVPADNALPWGYVEGTIASHEPDYPVIVQIFGAGGEPAHFGQAEVAADGSYEYRFRVSNVVDGERVSLFSGEYTAVAYKVVRLSGLQA